MQRSVCVAFQQHRDSKISQHQPPVCIQQQISGLYIEVNQPALMSVVQRSSSLFQVAQHLLWREDQRLGRLGKEGCCCRSNRCTSSARMAVEARSASCALITLSCSPASASPEICSTDPPRPSLAPAAVTISPSGLFSVASTLLSSLVCTSSIVSTLSFCLADISSIPLTVSFSLACASPVVSLTGERTGLPLEVSIPGETLLACSCAASSPGGSFLVSARTGSASARSDAACSSSCSGRSLSPSTSSAPLAVRPCCGATCRVSAAIIMASAGVSAVMPGAGTTVGTNERAGAAD